MCSAAFTSHWWWLERPPPPHMIVKRFGCTTIHNKALYKCLIHSFIEPEHEPQSFISEEQRWASVVRRLLDLLLLRVRVEAVLAPRVFLTEVLMNELQLRHQMKTHLQVHLQVLQPRLQLHKRRPAESRHTSISTGSLLYCFSFVKTTVIA